MKRKCSIDNDGNEVNIGNIRNWVKEEWFQWCLSEWELRNLNGEIVYDERERNQGKPYTFLIFVEWTYGIMHKHDK